MNTTLRVLTLLPPSGKVMKIALFPSEWFCLLKRGCIRCVVSPNIRIWPRRPLLWKRRTVSQYTHRGCFMYGPNKSTALPAPIFTKLTNRQQRYVQTCYTEFHETRGKTAVSADTHSGTPASKVRLALTRLSWSHAIWQFIGELWPWISRKSDTFRQWL